MKNHRVYNLQIVKKCKLFDNQIILFIVCNITLFNGNNIVLYTIAHSIENYI